MAFGGTHYPAKFNKLLLESDIALTSVVPKHSLDGVDSEMFGQIIQKTSRFPRFVAVDWKGMGQHKEKDPGVRRAVRARGHRGSDVAVSDPRPHSIRESTKALASNFFRSL